MRPNSGWRTFPTSHFARRYSLGGDNADDVLQRALEILLRKAPTDDPRELVKWMQTA